MIPNRKLTWFCFLFSTSLLLSQILIGIASQEANQLDSNQRINDDEIVIKLDRILLFIEDLSNKYEQLNKTLNAKENQQQQPPECNQIYHGTPHPNLISEKLGQQHYSSQTRQNGADLYSILALKAASLKHSQSDTSSAALGNSSDERIAESLEFVALVLKEQVSNFRNSMGKLMNRVWDQSYQLNSIANQLGSVKDECSLSLSLTPSQSIAITSQDNRSSTSENYENQPLDMGALKASQMVAIEKIISRSLGDLNLRVEFIFEQVSSYAKKFDEMSSIVKYSALMLAKLQRDQLQNNQNYNSRQSCASQVPDKLHTSEDVLTLTYSNQPTNGTSNETSTSKDSNGTRWFPGSKIPGLNKTSKATEINNNLVVTIETNNTTSEPQPAAWCRSKTNLVRPTSCLELRLAGANCTGQYYVFVQSTIAHVFCDMASDGDDQGGWTVVLRRLDKSLGDNGQASIGSSSSFSGRKLRQSTNQLLELAKASQTNFSLDLANYQRGFGDLNEWAEFFSGLDFLHHQTNHHPVKNGKTEMQIEIETNGSQHKRLTFDDFSIGDEQSMYKFNIGPCSESDPSLCEPIISLNNTQFSIHEPNGTSSRLGWWRDDTGSVLHLTKPIGKLPGGSEEHLFWPNWPYSEQPIRKLVMKIRHKRLLNKLN